jgi:phosphoserine phosphatase RsbU/P
LNVTDSHPQINFFRNYNRVVGVAYAAIVVGLLLVFGFQLKQKMTEEIALVQSHFERHAQFIEFVLRTSSDQLELLRMVAEDQSIPSTVVESRKRQLAITNDGFNLDLISDRDAGGNLIGVGSLNNRNNEFNQDINTAFALLPAFRTLAFILPSATQARYISANQFNVVTPWVPSKEKPFNSKVYDSPVWTLNGGTNGADHAKYWAPVYFGNKDQGLLVPAAAPVYQGKRFAGIVTFDTSIDYLNRINSGFGYPLGITFISDAFNTVLAHPKLYADALKVEVAPSLGEVVTPSSDTHVTFKHKFISAPWQLHYHLPRADIWEKLLLERGLFMCAVLAGITLLMLVTYKITSQEFVGPAAKLVSHLAKESKFIASVIPAVPVAWQPWFETVSKAFRESMQLVSLRRELNIAAEMQAAILPRNWPTHEDFSVWGSMRSAKEVGGDFYDHFPLADNRLGLVVADVSGKGVPAALFGMVSKTLLSAIATRATTQAGAVIAEVNNDLCKDNDNCMFVTTWYSIFNPKNGQLDYVNAGHPLPLLISANGEARFIEGTGGVALGIMSDVPFNQAQLTLQPGDTLLTFTDGITEAMNRELKEFGCEQLQELFSPTNPAFHKSMTVREIVEMAIAAVDRFADGEDQSDDITCVALQYHPKGIA